MKARIFVTLKPEVLDPQGKATEGALSALGFSGVRSVRQGRLFDVELDGEDWTEAQAELTRMCESLLVNRVIEDYSLERVS